MLKNIYRAKIQGTNMWIKGYLHSVYGNGFDSIQDAENHKRIEYIKTDTIGMSLGRIDKFGNEIFEGDYNEEGDCVIFCEKCMGFQFSIINEDYTTVLECHNCDGNFGFQDAIDDFIVKGSIY